MNISIIPTQFKLLVVITAALVLAGCHEKKAPVPDNTPTPLINTAGTVTIDGDTIRGATLTATVTDFNGASGPISYQWAADGADIAGATDRTYVLTDNELGTTIAVAAAYTDDKDFAENVTSDPTAVITLPPNQLGEVTIIGVPSVDETLTASVTDGNGTATSAFAYQWLADGADIAGATADSYLVTVAELGAEITVNATYTDDDTYAEDIVSDPVGPIVLGGANVAGTIAISGTLLVGETLTATVSDPNGFTVVNYQWDADGVDIPGATMATYDLTNTEKGTVISVTADYTDDDGFAEGPISDTATDIIHTVIVTNGLDLLGAAAAAVDGDIIGLDSAAGGDYNDMPEIVFSADDLLIKLTTGSTAVITGTTCIVYSSSSSGVTIDGLVFDDLSNPNTANCGEGEGSVRLQGSNNTFSNNQILGQADPRPAYLGSSDELHYMTVGGTDNVVERNLFEGLSTSEAEEGAAISMYISAGAGGINVSNGSNERNIIQYNLFRNFLPDKVESGDPTEWDTDSNGFGVQVGRSSSGDGTGLGAHVVQYNRFDTVLTDRRVILVQGGGNTIHGNTIVNSWGNIALEHGYDNTVSNNIVISNGVGYTEDPGPGGIAVSDNLDGGISFVPLGHTIIDNYVGNIASNSSDRAGLLIDSETLEPSDSSSFDILGSGLDLTTVVARNTVINVRNAIQFEHNAEESGVENCTNLDYLLDFDDNLVANQSSGESIFGTSAGASRTAILLDEYTTPHGCRLNDASEFTNTHIYSATISDDDILFRSGGTALVHGANGNIALDGSEDGATLTAPDANSLVEGAGADAGIGTDIDSLTFITEDMVGPGSTWTAL